MNASFIEQEKQPLRLGLCNDELAEQCERRASEASTELDTTFNSLAVAASKQKNARPTGGMNSKIGANASAIISGLSICGNCSKRESSVGEFQACGKCNIAKYCSPACQKADWKGRHKLVCK